MSDNCKCGKVNFERPSDFSIGLADESKHTRLTCFNPAPESDKQAAPASAGETDFAEELRKTSLVPTSEPESRVGSPYSFDRNVSAGEVKRYAYSSIPPCYQSPSAKGMFVLEADHLSIVAALQSRIATLEAELKQRRCDSESVDTCERCNAVFLARTLTELLARARGGQKK